MADTVRGSKKAFVELVGSLALFIGEFTWRENQEQTDADLRLEVRGLPENPLQNIVDLDAVNDKVVEAVVRKKALQFIDVCQVEDLNWGVEDRAGSKVLWASANIHLAE